MTDLKLLDRRFHTRSLLWIFGLFMSFSYLQVATALPSRPILSPCSHSLIFKAHQSIKSTNEKFLPYLATPVRPTCSNYAFLPNPPYIPNILHDTTPNAIKYPQPQPPSPSPTTDTRTSTPNAPPASHTPSRPPIPFPSKMPRSNTQPHAPKGGGTKSVN
jgi:hypothetical protein